MNSLVIILIASLIILVLHNNALRVKCKKVSSEAKVANADKEKIKEELSKAIEELKNENKALLRIMKN